jgi:hypothetical protein
MPPLVQGARERLGRVIDCFHVSGLEMRRSSWPRAGMAMRERLQIKAASLKLELRA